MDFLTVFLNSQSSLVMDFQDKVFPDKFSQDKLHLKDSLQDQMFQKDHNEGKRLYLICPQYQ